MEKKMFQRKRPSRIDKLKSRAELARAKSEKRKWLVYLLLTIAGIAAALWIIF